MLLIAYSYPPDPMVGAFRPAKVVRSLLAAGHEVDVITARMPGEASGLREQQPGLRVHAVTAIPNPRHWYLALRQLWRRTSRRSPANTAVAATPPQAVRSASGNRWKRLLISLLWTPDENQGFIPAAVSLGLRIARRGGVDLIYTTAPPFSDHIAGGLIKRLTGARWAMELRDPWSDNASRPIEARSRLSSGLNGWMERRCLTAADHVIAASEPVYRSLEAGMNGAGAKLHLVFNGIDEIATGLPDRIGGPAFVVTHAGSLYNDPRPFMRMVGAVAQRLNLGPNDLRINFLGGRSVYERPTLKELADELGIADMVEFSRWMPQRECRDIITQSDLLLLLCIGFPTAIPNKLFDYLGARKPVLAIVEPWSESARILQDQPGHFIHDGSDAAAIERDLERAIHERAARRELLNDREFLYGWSTDHQMEKLLKILGMAPPAPSASNARTTTSASSPGMATHHSAEL